jgi:hypothetical protein
MKHSCSTCSKEFVAKRNKSSHVYCSRKCFLIRPKRWTERQCLTCSKIFRTSPNWIKRGGGKYCSWKCSGLGRRDRAERNCQQCGAVFITRPFNVAYGRAKYCSTPCHTAAMTGKKRPHCSGPLASNWRGGIQFFPYPSEFNDALKEKIRNRDGHVCLLCGMTDEEHILVYGYQLVIHHSDYDKENCDESNLATTCIGCNSRVNYNRPYWTEHFAKLLKEKKHEHALKGFFSPSCFGDGFRSDRIGWNYESGRLGAVRVFDHWWRLVFLSFAWE